jgi:hypothetical protein
MRGEEEEREAVTEEKKRALREGGREGKGRSEATGQGTLLHARVGCPRLAGHH